MQQGEIHVELTYANLISELDIRFPQFKTYLSDLHKSIDGNVSVYFTFFSIYLKEHWMEDNLHRQLALLLQQMHTAADEATQITLHDFLLDICSSCKEHGTDLDKLLQHVTPPLQSQLHRINNDWLASACQLPQGGCC